MVGDVNSAERSLLCMFCAVPVVFFHPLLPPFWMADTGVLFKLIKLRPSFLTRGCHRSLCFCFLLYRNHSVFSFSYSHKMPICFSSICSPFPFFWLIIFFAGSMVIEAACEWTSNSLFTGAPAAFLCQNYFVQTKTLHSMHRNLFLSLRENTCSCSSIDHYLLWNTYLQTYVKKEKKYPLSDWGENLVDIWKYIHSISTVHLSGQHPHLAERSQSFLRSHPLLTVLSVKATKQWD